MTAKEAMRYQLKQLEGKPLKQKLEHIITYFWFPILAVLALLIFAVSYIVHVATLKDVALNVTCVNAIVEEDEVEAFTAQFAWEAGIDLKEYEVEIETDMMLLDEGMMSSYDSAEVLITLVAAQTIDVLVSDLESMFQHFYQDVLADLTEILSPEQQEKYQDYFLYIDMTVLSEVKKVTDLDNIPSFPDPQKPEEMEEPVPVAIRIPEKTEFAEEFFPDRKDNVVVGIVVNSRNTANALAFLDFIME